MAIFSLKSKPKEEKNKKPVYIFLIRGTKEDC